MAEVSPQASVHPSAQLADDVVVGAFTCIGPDVRIASGCTIENNVTITGRTLLGPNTHVYPLAVVGASPPQARAPGECIIGPNNTIREHVTIHAGAHDGPATQIGQDNLIMIATQIDFGGAIGNHGIFANCAVIEAGAVIEDYVRISAFSVIQADVRVGAYTFVASWTDVNHDAPPFAMLQGSPYRVRGVNSHNLKRCGFDDDDIRAIKHAFRGLFGDPAGSDVNAEALDKLRAEGDLNEHVRQLIEAVGRPRKAAAAPGECDE